LWASGYLMKEGVFVSDCWGGEKFIQTGSVAL